MIHSILDIIVLEILITSNTIKHSLTIWNYNDSTTYSFKWVKLTTNNLLTRYYMNLLMPDYATKRQNCQMCVHLVLQKLRKNIFEKFSKTT